MSFISLEFVVFFCACFFTYYLVGKSYRKYVLLLSSCIFIGYHHLSFLLVAMGVALFSYIAGRSIEKARDEKYFTARYVASVVAIVLFWIADRYAGTVSGSKFFLFSLGISFYSFQAISYLTEVYWGEEKAERSLPDFMLYMLFFMKFLSGPIERPGSFLPQIKNLRPATYEMMTYGLKLIAVGLIKKIVLADQIAPYISGVFDAPHAASGAQLIMACMLYPVELYADFSGYTDMALGGALMFGLRLSPNFNRPFVAQSTADLWRRWHMSLSFWVRDYVYLPLASATRYWEQKGIIFSLLLTFVALGIWHGSGWTFVIYGLIQGIVIVYEVKARNFRDWLKRFLGKNLFATWSILRTYIIFALSLIFFRCDTISDAFYFIRHMSFHTNTSWKEINLGMTDHICIVSGVALFLVLVYEFFMSRGDLLKRLQRQPAVVRWSVYYLIVFAIFVYGKFGANNFIYLEF